jgi:E3 ubiquitin-protein ligase TRIP12
LFFQLDIPLAIPFFKWILGEQENMGLQNLEQLEPTIYNSLRQIGKLEPDDFESFEMHFTYPGQDQFELIKGGKHKMLTYDNYRQFTELICQWRLIEGVRADMEAVQRGFQQVISNIDHLSIFEGCVFFQTDILTDYF